MAMGTKEVEVAVRDVENMRAAPPATTGKLTKTGYVIPILIHYHTSWAIVLALCKWLDGYTTGRNVWIQRWQ